MDHQLRDDFINSYRREDERVREFREREWYGRYALILSVISIIISGITFSVLERSVIYYGLGFVSMILFMTWVTSLYINYQSDLTREAVGYHKLAEAMEMSPEKQPDSELDAEDFMQKLKIAADYLDDRNTKYVSDKTVETFNEYVEALDESSELNDALNETFTEFAQELFKEVSAPELSDMERIVNGIEEDQDTEIEPVRRALRDYEGFVVTVLTGYWTVVLFAFGFGLTVFKWYNKGLGTMIIGSVLTAYVGYIRVKD